MKSPKELREYNKLAAVAVSSVDIVLTKDLTNTKDYDMLGLEFDDNNPATHIDGSLKEIFKG